MEKIPDHLSAVELDSPPIHLEPPPSTELIMSTEINQTSEQKSLDDFPDEILIEVVCRTDHGSLPALALVSRRFYGIVFPELYRSVTFLVARGENDYLGSSLSRIPNLDSPNPFTLDYPQTSRQVTTIKSLSNFARTIMQSERLRSAVVGATIEWDVDGDDNAFDLMDLLAPSLKFVHLSPTTYSPTLPILAPLASLTLSAVDLKSDTPAWDLYQDNLYRIFSIPSLSKLTLNGMWSWDSFDSIYDYTRWSTSSVSHLSFPLCTHAGPDLVEILNWPRALKTLFFFPTGWSRLIEHSHPVAPMEIADIICQQKDHLEECFLTGEVLPDDDNYSTAEGLRSMTKLKRFGLPRELLTMARLEAVPDEEDTQLAPLVHECVPPAIEVLQIEFFSRFDRQQYVLDTLHNYVGQEVEEIIRLLLEISLHKFSHYPQLKQIAIWRSGVDYEASTHGIDDEHIFTELGSIFRAAEIEVTCVTSHSPPLFCV